MAIKKEYPFVVKILSSDDGEERRDNVWCYVHTINGGNATLCGGEFFGIGESGCEYKTRIGKITCLDCIGIIKEIKEIRL